MYNNKELCKKVIKDYDIPLYYIDNIQFEKCMKTVYLPKKYKDAFKIAESYCKKYNLTCNQFIERVNDVIEKIIRHISNLDSYTKHFISEPPKKLFGELRGSFLGTKSLNIFKPENKDRKFISVDLVSANSQVFIRYGVTNKNFEELCFDFSYSEELAQYISNSKHLRQVVYGNLNPQRQQHAERIMTESVLDYLYSHYNIKEDDIVGYTTDEIILNYTDNTFNSLINSEYVADKVFEDIGISVRIVPFELHKIEPYNFYVKELLEKTRSFEFKCVPKKYYAQVVTYWFAVPMSEHYLRFLHEGDIVRFEKPLFLPK